jgi:hypothetical protein
MNDVLHLGDAVEVVTDRFSDDGVPRGSVGYIVDDWADGSYDVDVIDPATGDVAGRIRAAHGEVKPHSAPDVAETNPVREHGILFGRGDDLGAPVGGAPSPPGSQFAGLNGAGAEPWFSGAPPEGELKGDIPWELRDEPPSTPMPR